MSDNINIDDYPSFELGFAFDPEEFSSSDSWVFKVDLQDTNAPVVETTTNNRPLAHMEESRFPVLTEDDLNGIVEAATAKKTQATTKCHVKIFKGKVIFIQYLK